MREPLGSNSAGIFLIQLTLSCCHILSKYGKLFCLWWKIRQRYTILKPYDGETWL